MSRTRRVIAGCFVLACLSSHVTAAQVVTVDEALLVPGDVTQVIRYGHSVSLDGDRAIIGAPNETPNGGLGIAAVFVRSGSSWTQEAILDPVQSDFFFGWAVALEGDVAIVSAPGQEVEFFNEGSVHSFTRTGTVWTQTGDLVVSDPEWGASYGASVAISNDTVVVGARRVDEAASNSGAAYVFVRNGTEWIQQTKLAASDAAEGDDFGRSVAIDGDTIVVGAPFVDGAESDSGAAYVFTRTGSLWTEQAKLTTQSGEGDVFGWSVGLSEERVVVGAPRSDPSSFNDGAAYVFVRNGATWSEEVKLIALDTASQTQFGRSVAIDGDFLVIGRPFLFPPPAAYVYELTGNGWVQRAKFLASDGDILTHIGEAVDADDRNFIAGAPEDDEAGPDVGAAYAFTLGLEPFESLCEGDGGDLPGCTSCPCANDAPGTSGGCLNASGTSCVLIPHGDATFSGNSLGFNVTGANPLSSVRLASAVNSLPNAGPCHPGSGIASSLLDGLRCVGGELVRHGVRATNASGANTNSWGPPGPNPPDGLLMQGAIAAGQTRFFQCFYREDASLQCGTGQNTSNSIRVVVQP